MKILSHHQLKLKHLHRAEKTVNALIARRSESLFLSGRHTRYTIKFERAPIVSLLQVISAACQRHEKYRVRKTDMQISSTTGDFASNNSFSGTREFRRAETRGFHAWAYSERLIYKYVNNAPCAASISHAAGTNQWQLTYGRDQEDRLWFGHP